MTKYAEHHLWSAPSLGRIQSCAHMTLFVKHPSTICVFMATAVSLMNPPPPFFPPPDCLPSSLLSDWLLCCDRCMQISAAVLSPVGRGLMGCELSPADQGKRKGALSQSAASEPWHTKATLQSWCMVWHTDLVSVWRTVRLITSRDVILRPPHVFTTIRYLNLFYNLTIRYELCS